MPIRHSSIEKIRAELSWSMKRQIRKSAVVGMSSAVNVKVIFLVAAHFHRRTSCGHFDGNISAVYGGNTTGAEARCRER
jgi:hypothetical protein